MAFEHGVRILEQPTSLVAPVLGTAGLQVVFGTAPVNLADDPYNVTNKPIIAYRWAEAVSQLGYSEEQDSLGHYRYTLCASMYASFQLVGVAPVVFVNVLDPTKHKKKNDPAEVPVVDLEATVPITGILLDTVAVKFSDSEGTQVELKEKEDYILTFDDDGHLQITLVSSGAGAAAAKLTVDSTSIDPTALDSDDVIGVSAAGGERGMEVVRQVYPKLGMTPGLLLAPGWSHIPDAGIVLAAKCQEINGYFNCEGFIDIDSTESGCTRYSDVKTAKEAAGCTNKRIMALWPCIQVGSRKFWYSAIMGAVTAYVDATNDDVPSLSPSNKLIGVTGTVLADAVYTPNEDGTGGTWGNRTAAYPANTDPKDMFFCCRRFFSWWGNSFILTYFQKVDNPANRRLIETIVDTENKRGAAYVADEKCARAEIEFIASENPVTSLIDGKLRFHQYLTPYTPAEDILNVLEFDPYALESKLNGG